MDYEALTKWTAIYVRNDKPEDIKELDVFAETAFTAWWNAMSVIQIIEKTEEFNLNSVNPK